jgi:glycosyltransferase involved in cell wall biosynthesis
MLAARIARTNNRYSLIAGGGYVFSDQKKHRVLHRLLKSVVCFMCRRGIHHATKVLFQNEEDLKHFVELKLISKDRTIITGGTGVDLDILKQITPNTDDITFILVARLLQEKGIVDFVNAARIVRDATTNTRFILVGDFDTSPGGICKKQVNAWVNEGLVEWPGEVKDVYSWLTKSSVFVLPSYYREGVPRSTQEALATGLPVITTDSVGCRETVIAGETGLLVPVRDSEALSEAMMYFIKNPSEIKRMGSAGRKLAEQKFDVHKINNKILNAMGID